MFFFLRLLFFPLLLENFALLPLDRNTFLAVRLIANIAKTNWVALFLTDRWSVARIADPNLT